MPRVPLDRPATFDDLAALPDHLIAEIVDGELHASPRPSLKHSQSATRLVTFLGPAFDEGQGGPGGWTILFEPELHLHGNVLVPDLAAWRVERMSEAPEDAHASIAPDWVCEVLSPSTEVLDRGRKLVVYAREGVEYLWLVDPLARSLETFHLASGHWLRDAVFRDDDIVRAIPFDVRPLDLRRLWGRRIAPVPASRPPPTP